MDEIATQPLLGNEENLKTRKNHSKLKMFFIISICAVFSILVGFTIGYLIFGRKAKVAEIIFGDDTSEITDPFGTYALIDVRNQTEWDEFHINNSILIPAHEIEHKIGFYVQNKSFPIKLFCKSGRRASKAKEILLINGYRNVINLGGIERAKNLIKSTNSKIPFEVILTGFQPWGENEVNPSETLAEKVSQKLRENGDDSKSYSLKVTVEEANSFYNKILIEKNQSKLPFIIHIGLDGVRTDSMEIESTASNMAILTLDGRAQTVSNNKNLGYRLENTIDIEALVKSLETEFVISHNAGTNLCNYIYYRGLENVGIKSRGCIFVHIPHFTTLSLEVQIQNMIHLIQQIAKLPNLFL